MKKAILILFILMCAIGSQAQLSTNQFKQVTSMIATATKPLINDIAILKTQVKALQDSLTAFKNGIVKSNTMVYKRPLIGEKDSVLLNTFNISIDTLYLKR